MSKLPDLPVCETLPALRDALKSANRAVLAAPPGAGKTTIVPLALLDDLPADQGRIVLVEPRRIAARAAARRMAALLSDKVGGTVGYAMRLDNRSSAGTRILVVTEGVFTRMALDDPELSGIQMVIFDEFHERSLDGDFGLALALDIAGALRPDLKLLIMSATLDTDAVSGLIDAPVIESLGRSFPVELRHRPRSADQSIEQATAAAVRSALAEGRGSCLAFLPGKREIDRTAELLADRLPASVQLLPLHGGLDGKAQDAAIRPADAGTRKVVLTTAIAESSITIDGVDTVIDGGLARVPRFEPGTGLTRLETVRVSKASADQRAGRAGRTAPGVAVRLWHEAQNAALPDRAPPEILQADLTGLMLDCAAFGIVDPAALSLLDPPPAAALSVARQQLLDLGAIDTTSRITGKGRQLRRLPLPVRFANMVVNAAERGEALKAAEIALLLGERGVGGTDADLDRRHRRLMSDKGSRAARLRSLASRLARIAGSGDQAGNASTGRMLLDACPDRVAKARGDAGHFVLANGRGVRIDATDPLAREPYLVVADVQGAAKNARITAAASIDEADILKALAARIETKTDIEFDPEKGQLRQRGEQCLGAIRLRRDHLPPPRGEAAVRALVLAIRQYGVDILPWSKDAVSLRPRLSWLHQTLGPPWPPLDDKSLLDGLETWLLPYLTGEPDLAGLKGKALEHALMSLLPADLAGRLDEFAPPRWQAPAGNRIAIRYEADGPVLSIRVQELYGLDIHPTIAGGSVPLKLELLSPASRPVQTTTDLPGFWRGSWADLRRDMKGRYPKHVWPEEPQTATPTTRARQARQ